MKKSHYMVLSSFCSSRYCSFYIGVLFLTAMPVWVPFRLTIIYLSGIAEILMAVALLFKKTRRQAGILIAFFLVCIFPVNIYMAFISDKFDIPGYIFWLRLPLQVLFIWWVLKIRKY